MSVCGWDPISLMVWPPCGKQAVLNRGLFFGSSHRIDGAFTCEQDRHVAVAAAADSRQAAPQTATCRGNNVEAEFTTDVLVETMSDVAGAAR